MFKIDQSTNKIYISRGDTGTFSFTPYFRYGLDQYQYVFNKADELYFAVMEPNQCWEDALIKKKYTFEDINDDCTIDIKLKPNDTNCLYPGKYYYQIKLRSFKDNEPLVDTLITKTEFWIEE